VFNGYSWASFQYSGYVWVKERCSRWPCHVSLLFYLISSCKNSSPFNTHHLRQARLQCWMPLLMQVQYMVCFVQKTPSLCSKPLQNCFGIWCMWTIAQQLLRIFRERAGEISTVHGVHSSAEQAPVRCRRARRATGHSRSCTTACMLKRIYMTYVGDM